MNKDGQEKRSLSDRLNQTATAQSELIRKHATNEQVKTLEHWKTESESLRASITTELNTTKNAIHDQLKQIRNYWVMALLGVLGLLLIAVLSMVVLTIWKESEAAKFEARLSNLQQNIATARSTLQTLEEKTSGVIIFNQDGKNYLVIPNRTDLKNPLKCGTSQCFELPSK